MRFGASLERKPPRSLERSMHSAGWNWCRCPDSNWGPSHYECAALPTELQRRDSGRYARRDAGRILARRTAFTINAARRPDHDRTLAASARHRRAAPSAGDPCCAPDCADRYGPVSDAARRGAGPWRRRRGSGCPPTAGSAGSRRVTASIFAMHTASAPCAPDAAFSCSSNSFSLRIDSPQAAAPPLSFSFSCRCISI